MTVVVVGAGPAGLACAVELRRRGVPEVLVVDRERRAGGIPRHCAHRGFGLRDLHRVHSGPRYAERYVELARKAGVSVSVETMMTGWSADGGLEVTSPRGRDVLYAPAVVLSTGCRERPRSARLVPGSRPEGVLTTGLLQQLVERGDPQIGSRAMIVGAEHVSFSALMTLADAGVKVAGMVTDLPRHQSFALARAGAALRYRVPVWTRTVVTGIHGDPRLEELELRELGTGRTRRVACDTVVFTGDWIPDHELAVMAGVELDPGTRGPRVDTSLRTTRKGVFAAGNVLQGAEPADVAALSGRHVAASVERWLVDRAPWPEARIPMVCREPLHWISPNSVTSAPSAPPRGQFLLRAKAFLRRPQLELRQDGRLLLRQRLARVAPGRSSRASAAWIAAVDPTGGPIDCSLQPPLRSPHRRRG